MQKKVPSWAGTSLMGGDQIFGKQTMGEMVTRREGGTNTNDFRNCLFQTTEIFYSPDDAIATVVARFGEETRPGGGFVFNLKWIRYMINDIM